MEEPQAFDPPVDRPAHELAAEYDASPPRAPAYWPSAGQQPVDPAAGSAIGDAPAPAQPPFGGGSELPPSPPIANAEPPPGTPPYEAPAGFGSPPPPPPPPTSGSARGYPSPTPRRRAARPAAAAVAVLALLGGAGGGWLAGHAAADHGSTPTATVPIDRASDRLSGSSLDVAQVLQKVEPSVVSITTTITQQPQGPFDYGYNNGGGWGNWDNGGDGSNGVVGQAAGSGIIITADGEVLTNAHVIQDASSIKVTLTNGHTYSAKVVGSDTGQDLALLKLQGASGLTPATLGSSSGVRVGDDVVAIGNALALSGGPTVTRGIVSAVNRSIDEDNGTLQGLIQTDAAISSGNSGGPLVNAQGQVVGINTAVASSSGTTQASNIGFAISIDHARSLLSELRSGGSH